MFSLERIFQEAISKVWLKLQQIRVRTSTQFSFVAGLMNFEDESNDSKITFYFLSLMLLISLILLSPDKLLQAFSPTQVDNGIVEKMQEMARIIKRLASNFV